MNRKKLITFFVSLCMISSIFIKRNLIEVSAEGENGETYTYSAVNPYYGGWSNCTWSAWQLCYNATGYALPRFGSAGAWYSNAAAMGFEVGQYPRAYSIGVWSSHVVWLGAYDGGDMAYIQEGGYLGGYHEEWIYPTSNRNGKIFYGWIYIPVDGSYPINTSAPVYTQETETKEENSNTTTQQSIAQTKKAISEDAASQLEIEEGIVVVNDASADMVVKQEDANAAEEIRKDDNILVGTFESDNYSCE